MSCYVLWNLTSVQFTSQCYTSVNLGLKWYSRWVYLQKQVNKPANKDYHGILGNTSVWPVMLSRYDKVLILKSWVEYNVLKNFHSIQLSIGVSFSISITCFHSTTNNLTLLCSVSVVQSQDPLHVLIVWQKPQVPLHVFIVWQKHHFTALSFSFSIPSPITCFNSMAKNFTLLCSISIFQSQVMLLYQIEKWAT